MKRGFLQEPHGITSQKTSFFIIHLYNIQIIIRKLSVCHKEQKLNEPLNLLFLASLWEQKWRYTNLFSVILALTELRAIICSYELSLLLKLRPRSKYTGYIFSAVYLPKAHPNVMPNLLIALPWEHFQEVPCTKIPYPFLIFLILDTFQPQALLFI
jgi:hypothetical protein